MVDLVDLLGGNVQKLIGLIVRNDESISAETLNRDWSMVQIVSLTVTELDTIRQEIRITPMGQADGSIAYDVSIWLRWGDHELEISSMLPSLCMCLNADAVSDWQYAVGYQAERTEGFLPLDSMFVLIPEEMPEHQTDEAEKFIVTISEDDSAIPVTVYDADASLAQDAMAF